ncbi:melanoma-associated antigen 9-like [Hyaena hyaena]|uniref:melanoma-associated antigen 9-like n=1 Tax=Hyaena hyaena TaxID=95912 RepID=UPI001923103A|nr:melanoma-associated antigen 9-like [Hyaena hyaena]
MPLQREGWTLEEDPEEAEGLVDAQLSGAEDEEETPSPSSSSPSSSLSSSSLSSSCSFLLMIPVEEGSAAGSLSPPQSPQSAGPSPADMAGAPESQSDEEPSNPDEEESSSWGDPAVAEPLLQDALNMKLTDLLAFLLVKYRTKQPTTQAEMLTVVSPDVQDQFPVIFHQACQYLLLVFGVDVKEVDPGEHSYVLDTILGLTCGGMLRGKQAMPTTSLLVVVLGVILLEDECAPEEEVWKVLGVLGVYDGREHIFYGDPRELLTEVWVQEGYLEYRQVPGSEPARYEFLWGPRAHAETSSVHVLQHILMRPAEVLRLLRRSLREHCGRHLAWTPAQGQPSESRPHGGPWDPGAGPVGLSPSAFPVPWSQRGEAWV